MTSSITRLLVRLVCYFLVATGVISTEFANFLIYDPDIALIANAVVGVILVEAARLGINYTGLYERLKERYGDVVDPQE